MSAVILRTLFPDVRAEIIRCLFFDPTRELHVRALARQTTLALRTVQRELARLSKIGLVISWSNRYQRFYRANKFHPAFADIQQLVIKDQASRVFVSGHKRPRVSRNRRRMKNQPQFAPTIISSAGLRRRII